VIQYRSLNSKGLSEYISSKEYEELNIIPITKHRAISHINNPRLNETDILLILAMEDNKLAGYLGILPDYIYNTRQEAIKCGWLSCFWVNPLKRGQGIGEQLIRKSLEYWNDSILSADYVPVSKKVYDKTKAFNKPYGKNGIRLYYRMDLYTILPPKNKFFYKIRHLLKILDFVFNIPIDIRLLFLKNSVKDVKFNYIDNIDDETEQFINGFQINQLFKRGKTELNWITKYPWVLSANSTNSSNQQYHFSSTEKAFDFYKIKLFNDQDQLIAFIVLSKRNQILKIPYCFVQKDYLPKVVELLVFHIVKWRISTFSAFHPGLVLYLTKVNTFQIYKKNIVKNYLVTSKIYPLFTIAELTIQDGDGDLAFT
jgi:GNAT superfamily N-acetyltransferase